MDMEQDDPHLPLNYEALDPVPRPTPGPYPNAKNSDFCNPDQEKEVRATVRDMLSRLSNEAESDEEEDGDVSDSCSIEVIGTSSPVPGPTPTVKIPHSATIAQDPDQEQEDIKLTLDLKEIARKMHCLSSPKASVNSIPEPDDSEKQGEDDLKPDIKLLEFESTSIIPSHHNDTDKLDLLNKPSGNDAGETLFSDPIKEEPLSEREPETDGEGDNDMAESDERDNEDIENEIDENNKQLQQRVPRPRKRTIIKRKVLRRKRRKIHPSKGENTIIRGIDPSAEKHSHISQNDVEIKEESEIGSDNNESRNALDESRKGPGRKRKSTLKKEEDDESEEETNGKGFELGSKKILETDMIVYRNTIYRLGDVIDVIGHDSLKYFGQIQRFLGDMNCEKYIIIRWLLPKPEFSFPNGTREFNPHGFRQGPFENEPINMRDVEFVMSRPDALCESVYDPIYNKLGQYALLFNSNYPNNLKTSIAHCKL